MKRKILSLLMLLMAVSGAWADGSGTPDDPWISGDCTLILSEGTLTVSKKSGTGAMADIDYYDNTPWYSKKGDIKSIVIGSGVTSIGDYAFEDCNNLASVSIPASVISIGEHAFQSCGTDATALTVTFAEGSTPMTIGESAFKNTNLTSITIPNRVTSIGNYAFGYCTNLASVSIPASVTSIGVEAFLQCGRNAAALTVTFAEGTSPMTIGSAAFAESNLTSITIPNRVTSIGNYAFHQCTNLASVYVMASTPPALGELAFDGNASGRKIYVPASSVGDASTDGTYKHNWSAYADDIEAFPVTATGDCGTNCTYTLYGNGQLVISGSGAMADYNDYTDTPWYSKKGDIKSIVIGNGVTSIGNYAFGDCTNLASVSIPASVTSIGEEAFYNCGTHAAALTVNFAEGTSPMTIGYSAFNNANLTSITIPNRVTSIGNYAFHQCTNLASVYVMASTPPALGEFAFEENADERKIYVPAGSVGNSSTDGTYIKEWSAYAADIEALSAIGYCGDNCTYALHENGRLVISGTGAMADFPNPIDIPWLNNLSDITSVVIEEGVTSIGNWAFLECNKLASVSIPASVICIGKHAFQSCGTDATALTVTFAEGTSPMTIGYYAFGGANLTSITIPNRVTSIGESAFFLCSSLASVYVMATNPPTIGDDAFANNKDGRKIYVPSTAVDTYKSEWSVYESYIEAITASGNCGAEGHVSDVRWVLAGESPNYTLAIMKVGETGAMADYNNLSSRPWYDYRSSITTVNIENGVTSIGKYAFEQFDKMTSITIGDGVTSIGDYAFRRCKGLTSLTVPNGLATIGEDVFVGCIGLATITVASGNTAFKAENGVLLTDDGTELVLYPAAKAATTYTIPDYVTTIRDCAFYKCNLTEVTIPASVTNIGQQAFCECSNLATVTLLPVTPPTLGVSVFDDIGTNVNSNDKKFYFHGTAYGSNTDWNVSGYTPTVIYGATLSSGATTSTEAICSEGTTKYYTEGTSITLGHGDAPTGYTFGGYTAKDAADNDITATAISGSTLTMPASDVTVSVSFKKLLTNTDITIAEIADQTYTGSEIKPAVTVKDGETDITDQCDITYTNNTNAGTATVTIKAKASSTSYAGETTKSFKIILTGDINGDNVVNVADIVKAINDGKSQDEIKKIEKIIMNK